MPGSYSFRMHADYGLGSYVGVDKESGTASIIASARPVRVQNAMEMELTAGVSQ